MVIAENGSAALARVLDALDRKRTQPLYLQLQQALRAAIESRALPPAEALPSERQMAAELAVSRITVRKAIDGLTADGLLERRHGSGNFVCARIDKSFAKITSFSEDMRARGRSPRSVWLKRAEGRVAPDEALKMALSPGSAVYRFVRLRIADDAPMAIETATVAAWALPSVDSVEASLYDALERHGHRPARALQRLHALLLSTEQATLLEARPRDAGLMVERLGYLRDGRAVEWSQSIYRGDTYDFVAELSAD